MGFPQLRTLEIQYLVSLRGICCREGSHSEGQAQPHVCLTGCYSVLGTESRWTAAARMSLLGSSLESSSCSFVPCPCMCLISTLSGVWIQPRLRMQHRSLCEAPSVNMSAVPKWLLLQSMMFTKPGRKAVSYFSPLPTSFLESPAISLALQTEMIGRLCSQDDVRVFLSIGSPPGLDPGWGTAHSGCHPS